jgi:TnpA family transposase
VPARLPTPRTLTADAYLADRMPLLDAQLLEMARKLERGDITGAELTNDRVKLKRPAADGDPEVKALARRAYRLLPNVRLTDLLEDVQGWTGFLDKFRHLQTGKPIEDKRALLAALIAEATNIGLGRMADICQAASRRTLTTINIWYMREETYRTALARIVEAQHNEAVAAAFGTGHMSTSDGQHFYLGGEGEAAGEVNAHYGRDAIVKLYTHISDRYAPFHVKVITGTSSEALHVLDGLVNHDSAIEIDTHHTDGGGVSDHVFAAMYLLGIKFQPRMASLKERRLYTFQPRNRYGVLARFMGERLDRELIENNWDDVQRVISAIRNRTAAPSFILRRLGGTPRQSAMSLAMREIGRIERTLQSIRWIEDPNLRRGTTEELNKGEARNSLSRAVSLYRQGRFRDRSFDRQSHRAAALNLVTACIGLFNSRYIDRCLTELRRQQVRLDERHVSRLSPLGWDHINLTGDYVWTENARLDADGLRPLKLTGLNGSSH